MARFVLALLAFVVPASAASPVALAGSVPRGYSVDWEEAQSDPPAPREETTGDYSCSIERSAPDSISAGLLAIAESTYPPRSLIVDVALTQGTELGPDTARATLWWSHGVGRRRVPYAVTRAALAHYLKLTQKYRAGDYPEPGARHIFASALHYTATISHRDEFEVRDQSFRDVYVASVGLSWTYDDGTFLPLVTARRTVVLSARGDILAIDGDGASIEDVTFSSYRGLGRETLQLR